MEPIVQFDGNDTLEDNYEFLVAPNQNHYTVPSFQPNFRSANYALNQDKQANKIREDASLNDYEVTVNNNDQNVTIKCSSGFYIQVAKASFMTLDKCSVLSTAKVAITVDEIAVTKDKSGLEATRLIHFSFKTEQKSLGGVALHLHHSSRTLQVQGSYIMPDSSRAALWFLNNAIISRFKDLAKTKKFAIKNFNDAVLKLPQKNSSQNLSNNACQACNTIFNTQSKPSQCVRCLMFFHKTSCLKDHIKACKVPPASNTQPSLPCLVASSPCASSKYSLPPAVPAPLSGSSTTSIHQANRPRTRTSDTLVSLPPSSRMSSSVPLTSTTSLASTPSAPTSSIFSAASSGSIPFIPCLSSSAPKGPQNKSKTNKKKSLPTSADEITIEFLETELKAAQTKIVLLDAQIKDKDMERSVLWARIKIFEEKQNKSVFDKYFPSNNDHSSSNLASSDHLPPSTGSAPPPPPCTACPTPPTCPAPPRCSVLPPGPHCSCSQICSATPGCSFHRHCHHSSSNSQPLKPCNHSCILETSDLVKKVGTITSKMEELSKAFLELKTSQLEPKVPSINPEDNDILEEDTVQDFEADEELTEPDDDMNTEPDPSVNLDASIASTEEFMNDIPSLPSSIHLKALDPTIQLQ